MRGDPPQNRSFNSVSLKSTPHARGSTRGRVLALTHKRVYPACAGIHRSRYRTSE